jgi:hypothetical protein
MSIVLAASKEHGDAWHGVIALDEHELAAVFWALDYYLAKAYAGSGVRLELRAGAERAREAILQASVRRKRAVEAAA